MEQTTMTYTRPLLPEWGNCALMLAVIGALLMSCWTLWQRQVPPEPQSWVLAQVTLTAYVTVDMGEEYTGLEREAYALQKRKVLGDFEFKEAKPSQVVRLSSPQREGVALAGYVVRQLVREEVDSFMYRAQLLGEVGRQLVD